MMDNRSFGDPTEAANFVSVNRPFGDATVDSDLQEYDPATVDLYSERARIRADLICADWRISVTVYLLFIGLALLVY